MFRALERERHRLALAGQWNTNTGAIINWKMQGLWFRMSPDERAASEVELEHLWDDVPGGSPGAPVDENGGWLVPSPLAASLL
jgi:hypothetical protein